ncbi:MAG TPA: hypothetical protein VFN57_02890 [Thermomicrobiaceae bacterium]|nr:hypothetical protein [Thermomicrobiaceae bacterium]
MRLLEFLSSYPERLWLGIGDPPVWHPVPGALSYIPPAHLEHQILITRRPGIPPEGHIWIEELAAGYAWRATPPPGPPESPSMSVRWRAWRRGSWP